MAGGGIKVIVPDTSLLRSFHDLGRLDLVAAYCESWPSVEAAWASEVARECDDQSLPLGALKEMFGTPIEATAPQGARARDLRAMFFDDDTKVMLGRRHDMGECVTLVIWSDRAAYGDATLVLTEDRSTVLFCKQTMVKAKEGGATRESDAVSGRVFIPVTTADLLAKLIGRDVPGVQGKAVGADGAESKKFAQKDVDSLREQLRDLGRPWLGPWRTVTA